MSMNTLIVGKTSGGTPIPIQVDSAGKLMMAATFTGTVSVGSVSIDHTTPGTTDAVVVSSSALPTGAATQATLSTLNGKVTACDTGAVVVSSSSLPTGAATETTSSAILAKLISAPATAANQTTANSSLSSIDGKITACNTGAVVVASGAITATPVAPSLATSSAYEASRVVKASSGRLMSITGYNSGPAQFIQVHNATSLPADTTAPVLVLAVPSLSTFSFDFGGVGLPLSTGIVVCNSSTAPTKTIGSANVYYTAVYI
jgi:hypothetical protein